MKPEELKRAKTLDVARWTLVAILVCLIVGGNVYFGSMALPIRLTFMIIGAIVALLVALGTEKGKMGWRFLQEARVELRKVVWPTRHETMQTTLIIAGMVVIMALILWGIDSLFAYFVSSLLI